MALGHPISSFDSLSDASPTVGCVAPDKHSAGTVHGIHARKKHSRLSKCDRLISPILPFFSSQLMEILSDERNAHIISWLPHGTGFQIHKKKTFATGMLCLSC